MNTDVVNSRLDAIERQLGKKSGASPNLVFVKMLHHWTCREQAGLGLQYGQDGRGVDPTQAYQDWVRVNAEYHR